MLKKICLIGLLGLLGSVVIFAVTPTPTAQTIITQANLAAYYQGDDGRAEVEMQIKNANGALRKRSFIILRKDKVEGESQYYYVYFKRPTDVRKMVFMVWKYSDQDDDRWLYLPALDLVKRIAASDKRTSFVGSDFLYEDVSGRNPMADNHTLLQTTDEYYLVQSKPKDQESVEFAYYQTWLDKQTFLPLKALYFNDQDQLIREIVALETETIQGLPTITKMQVRNRQTGSETVLTFKNISYNLGLKSNLFTERYLRRAPKEVRR
jgi:hypothetical protein